VDFSFLSKINSTLDCTKRITPNQIDNTPQAPKQTPVVQTRQEGYDSKSDFAQGPKPKAKEGTS
jgi:hypothetical protein